MDKYLGIDIGGTYIKYGTYNEQGEELSSEKIRTRLDNSDVFINIIANIIYKNYYVDGIGISMPGFIDVNSGLIIDPGSIKPLKGKNLKEIIIEKCNREVDIENDANCVALAEKWKGNGKNYSNFVTFTIGTGIGGGIIIDNKLYRGSRFMGGEFGYMVVNGIKDNVHFMNFTSNYNASTSSLIKLVAELKNRPIENLNGEEIFDMIENRDKEVIEVYEKWIENLSLTIYNLVFTLNPDAVLIGGGVSKQSKVLEDIKNKINEFDKRISQFVVIDICKFNNDSGKIGAVYNHLVNKKKSLNCVE